MSTKKQKQMEPESSSSSEEEASDQEDVPQHTANTATGKSKASNTKENDSSSSSASDSSSEDSSDANEEDVKTEDAGVSKQSAQDAHSSSDSDSDSDSDASETEDTEDKQPQGSHEEAKALTSDTGVGQKRPRESTDTGGDDKADMTVFVEGISYDADENDMKDVFKKCGEILSIRMPRYQDSGKPRGYCHVEFSTSEACNKALNMDGLTHFGRYLTVRRANLPKDCQSRGTQRPRPPSCRTIYAKNLPYDTTESAMKEYFQQFGDVTNVRLARWSHTQRLKGFGYVQFETTRGVEKVMKAANNGKVQIEGRGLILDYETAPPKRSFKTPNGRSWQKEEQRAASALKRDKSRRQKILAK